MRRYKEKTDERGMLSVCPWCYFVGSFRAAFDAIPSTKSMITTLTLAMMTVIWTKTDDSCRVLHLFRHPHVSIQE